MKKLVFFFITATIVLSSCNFSIKTNHGKKNNGLAGVYLGIQPCADCSGIKTEIRLNPDSTYETAIRYLGKPVDVFLSHGHFKWRKKGQEIILENAEEPSITPDQFLVRKDSLIALNRDGKRFQGTLPPNTFIFRKITFNDSITGKCWRLIELNGKKIIFYNRLKRIPNFTLNSNNRINGTDGCNTFIGNYKTLSQNKIRFFNFISTKMACLDAPYQKKFLKIIEQVNNYSLKGDTLSLSKDKVNPLAKFVVIYVK